jgi:hypothetical protein
VPDGDPITRTVYVVPHTHWDREWYAPFQTFRAQLVDLWDELLTLSEVDPDFRFLMDGQTVVIEDYLAIRPEARSRLVRAIRDGQIQVGPWYTLPDEFLVSGETLVRNLERGLAVADEYGGSLRAGYLPDSFGHAAQMPQIYQQYGFRHAVVWRGVPLAIDRLAFNWEAPDGSRVLTAYMGGSYSHGVDLPIEPRALAVRIDSALRALAPFRPADSVLLMNGNDHVLPQRGLGAAVKSANAHLQGTQLRLARLADYLEVIPDAGWPHWLGELRASARANVLMGTLSVRIADKQRYFQASQALERMAEPLVSLTRCDIGGLLDQAWTLVLQNAAHDTACGSGIDAVAQEARLRSEAALQIVDAITTRCLPHLAGDGQVWNPSPFPRQELVEIEIDSDTETAPDGGQLLADPTPGETILLRFPAADIGRVHAFLDERRIADEVVTGVRTTRDGTTVRVLVDTRRRGVSADLADARLTMERIANEPGVEVLAVEVRRAAAQRALVESPVVAGLSVASLTSNQAAPARVAVIGRADTLANEHLTCRFLGDGTLEVEHRETGVRYTGLHRLVDDGDAGDEYNYSPVPVERGIADPLRWLRPPRVQESGPLRASMAARFEYRVPAAIAPDRQSRSVRDVPLDVALEVTLERGATRLDFAMQVVNTALDHRLRLHFPIPFTVTHSNADTAYHVTRRPVLAPRHTEGAPEWELPTHPMRSFVDLSDERTGMALITQGLHEYEVITGPPPALALTLLRSVGWLSRQDLRYRTGHAGPPMETPGAQASGLQQYGYSLLFHAGGWEQADVWRAAECAVLPLVPGRGASRRDTTSRLELEPGCIQMTACMPRVGGFDLRLLNASGAPQNALVRLTPAPSRARRITLGGQVDDRVDRHGEVIRLPLRQWEIATLQIRDTPAG